MIRKGKIKRRAQSIVEYAILIAIAVAAVTAMRTYMQRGMQAHFKVIQDQLNSPIEVHDPEINVIN